MNVPAKHLRKNLTQLFSRRVALLFTFSMTLSSQAQVAIPAGSEGPDWASGVRTVDDNMLDLGNTSKFDICLLFPAKSIPTTWAGLSKQITHKFNLPKCSNYVYSMATMPTNGPNSKQNCGIFKDISDGKYDSYYKATAVALRNSGAPSNLIIRFGWEQNHKSFPWTMVGCKTQTDATNYKAGYSRIVKIFRDNFSQNLKANWSFTKDGSKLLPTFESYYPGNSVIDVIGLDYYDNYLDADTLAKFQASSQLGTANTPFGISKWADFARNNGRQLAIDEWGVRNQPKFKGSGGDNPEYIKGMNWFFNTRKNDLAYEIYFNQLSYHLIGPKTNSPKAGAQYKLMWK